MKSKIILPILAASLLVTGCSANADSSSKSIISQHTMSKADKEKIDQDIQKVLDDIDSIFKNKFYIKNGYFSGNAYGKLKNKLNTIAIALDNKKKLDDNYKPTIKKFSLQLKKQIEKLNYNDKKKFLAKLNSPETQYNAIYRDDFYLSLYTFDREHYIGNRLDSFIDDITSDDVKEKDAVERINDEYKDSLSYMDDWEKEDKLFREKNGDNFDDEGYRTMQSVFANFEELEENEQSLIEGINDGKDLNLEKVLNTNDRLVKEQIRLFKKLNKKYNTPDDLTYDDYVYKQD